VRRALGTSLALFFGAVGPALGQYSPAGTGGVAALADALRQLGPTKRILMIGAHPDDEYSDLVALFARGLGAQVAYLSLSRGEGGQNLIRISWRCSRGGWGRKWPICRSAGARADRT